jgi:PqqD family protein of HPr-rel-A system
VPQLSPDTVLARRTDALTAPVDDDLVLLDPRGGSYFGLDSAGRRIWELLEQPRSVKELCDALEAEFDVDAGTCRAEVVPFLEQLAEAQLVQIR